MRLFVIAGITLAASMPVQITLADDLDTSDVDSYLMQDMENALKSLEPSLTVHNGDSAQADAQVLHDGLKYIYDYFVAKEKAPDAVQIAVEGQAAIARVIAALKAKNFDAAIPAARDTAKNCKSYHDIYKH
jgi:hypothetical protein